MIFETYLTMWKFSKYIEQQMKLNVALNCAEDLSRLD